MFPQSATHIPQGFRNAGLNLLEIPKWARVGKLDFNRWMGFAQNWKGARAMEAGMASAADEMVRTGVFALGTGSGIAGYKAGQKIAEYAVGDEDR